MKKIEIWWICGDLILELRLWSKFLGDLLFNILVSFGVNIFCKILVVVLFGGVERLLFRRLVNFVNVWIVSIVCIFLVVWIWFLIWGLLVELFLVVELYCRSSGIKNLK